VLRIAERQWGPEHPYTASCLARVAEIAKQQGKDEQAEHLYQRVLAIAEQQWGPVHPYTASYLNTLALLYAHCGKDEQAQDYSQRARAIWEQVLKPPNPYPAGREASIRGRKKKTDVPTHQVQPQLVNIGQEKNS
jgi:tetratricopeptide (TPR) repeat protein